jgi:Subtilase family
MPLVSCRSQATGNARVRPARMAASEIPEADPVHKISRIALAATTALLLAACAAPPSSGPAGTVTAAGAVKPRIEKAADLPRFSYPIKGRLEDIVRSREAFAAFAAPLRRDTESVLSGYDIADKGMQRDLMTQLAILDYLDGQYAQSLKRLQQVQALQDKPADKLMSGLRLRSAAAAALKHAPGTPAHAQAVAELLKSELNSMPFAVVANEVRELKSSAELAGEGLVLGRVREVLQPLADTNGSLSGETAPGLAAARLSLTMTVPLKAVWLDAFTGYLAANKVDKPDIWAARNFSLPATGPYSTVAVAVWDSGVDSALFKSQLASAGGVTPPVMGFDKYGKPANSELAPLPEAVRAKLPLMTARTKGFSDLQSNIDSPEASEVKQWLSTLPPDQYKPAIEEIGLIGNFEHGTHVAGITLDGNPHARLVVARIEFGHTLKPDPCPSKELALLDARNGQATVDFFKRNGVRVVNMSWGGSVSDVESELEKCGIGATPEARKAQARELFDIQKSALTSAMASAPQILFIAAAGNENQDSSFAESMPADIVLPNLLTVGAVDRAGDEAGFTSYGPTVKLHANGYQVDSYLPGGRRVALSGTSMAAPQAANLATKLLAVKPQLTVAQLIQAMVGTAEKTADGRRTLMHPKRALAAVQAR